MFCLFVVVAKVRSKSFCVAHSVSNEIRRNKRKDEAKARDYFDRDVLRRKKVAHQKKNTFRANAHLRLSTRIVLVLRAIRTCYEE